MLKYHIINLASCRLCPRRAAGGKERRYMDQNDKNKSNKNNDRRKGVLSLLIWALVLTIGFNYLLSAMDTRKLAEGTCEIRYDEFLDLVRDGKVKEVEIADRTLNITPVDGFTYTDADAIGEWALESVVYCTAAGYLAGSNGAFNPKGTATRAMGAKVLMNMTKEAA